MIYNIKIENLKEINLCVTLFSKYIKFLKTSFNVKSLYFLQILSKLKF